MPVILACGCVPVETEEEEAEVRAPLGRVLLGGIILVVVNLAIVALEADLGVQAETARAAAVTSGAQARLEAEGLSAVSSSTLAAVLGAFGTDAWVAAVALAVLTGALSALTIPLTITALVRKSLRLTRLAQGFTTFTTVLILLVILSLGGAGHLATRDNAGLTGLYMAQGGVAAWAFGDVAIRLEALLKDPKFWLFAKTHAIDLNTEVMLELEKRREEDKMTKA